MRFWSDSDSEDGCETHCWSQGADVPCVLLVLLIGLGSHSSKNALAPAAPFLEEEGMSPLVYSFVAASPQLGAIVAPVLWGVAYTWSERLVQVLVPLGDFLGQLVLALGIAMVDSDSPALESQAVLTAGLLIFSVARAGVGVVQHAAMARLLHGKRLMVGFVAMIFFGHLVVAACNWSVPRVLRFGILTLQLTLLLPNVVSVAADAVLSASWSLLPARMHSPPRTLSPDPSVLSLPLLEEEPVSPSPAKEGHCAMSVSYDCCPFCGDEELQSRKTIWLLGIWRALLLGLLHAFQSVTNDFLVGLGKTHMEAGSVVAMNQLLAMGLMPLVAFGGYFVGLRCTLVVISLLPFLGALLLAFLPTVPLVLEAGLIAIAIASTVMPVLPLVLVPANSRSCGKSFGLLDSLFGFGQAIFTIGLGELRKAGGFSLAMPFLCAFLALAAILSTVVAAVVKV
ncbi:unnamed protein product [Durusdinium trenchii]|uniref:Solute carrier family 40 protein n=1 Tax=Durusdinium trenchii TaxID=1381693 RepID=A0ABP0QJ42_9DINO